MRLAGERAARRPAGAPAASAEAPPEWWWDEFGARQRDLRVRLLRWLRRYGEPWVSESHLRELARDGRAKYSGPEVAHGLAALEAEGLVASERRVRPVHHGSKITREFTYWRESPGGDPCRS